MSTAMQNLEERFVFRSSLRRNILLICVIGLTLLILGLVFHEIAGSHGDAAHGAGSHDESGSTFTRLITSLWLNNVFFTGLAAVGVLFVAIHYASQAGWSALVKRVPEAFGYWLPFAGLFMLAFFLVGNHQLFHWTHHSLYEPRLADGGANPDYDPIIAGKAAYLNTPFYLVRMVVFFLLWYMLFLALRRCSRAEDRLGGIGPWRRAVRLSAIFIIIFAFSSPVAAWDWIMSIDTHWFSTMFGWYVFASWWVCALALMTYLVIWLKARGYLAAVNANHFHDLGKYIFAFSIFWTYIWFSQYMLIYYSNIPEETIYFYERLHGPYAWMFYLNLLMNFALPFLLLMTRDAKRHTQILALVCPLVIFGHWLDFILMVSPGVLKSHGGNIGLIEIGGLLIFGSLFLYVFFLGLRRVGLVAKHDPMLQESIHHHT